MADMWDWIKNIALYVGLLAQGGSSYFMNLAPKAMILIGFAGAIQIWQLWQKKG